MHKRFTGLGIALGLLCLFMTGCMPVIPEEIRQDISSPVNLAPELTEDQRAVQEIIESCTSPLPYRHFGAWRTADWICADDAMRRTAARTFFERYDPDGYAAVIAYGSPDYLNEILDGYTAAMDNFFTETKGMFTLEDFAQVNKEAAREAAVDGSGEDAAAENTEGGNK